MFIIIVKYIIIVHCYRRIIACKFTDYPALRSPTHPHLKASLFYRSPTLLPSNIRTLYSRHLYLSFDTYIPFD